MRLGAKEMNKPVEIEFVVDFNRKEQNKIFFYLLQIRPIATKEESVHLQPSKIKQEKCLIISNSALGNGTIEGIHDVE